MTNMIKLVSVCLASTALVFGAAACGSSDTTTTTPEATTTEVVTTTTPATTTDPNGDPNGVQPIKPASGGTPAECPSAEPQYDPATGLCYPNGAKMPE
jgi:hypothetical protein